MTSRLGRWGGKREEGRGCDKKKKIQKKFQKDQKNSFKETMKKSHRINGGEEGGDFLLKKIQKSK